MMIKEGSISLTGVVAGVYIASDPIDTTRLRERDFKLRVAITGDNGVSIAETEIAYDGSYRFSGTTHYIGSYLIYSGTSVSGPSVDGRDSASFDPGAFPFIRIKAKNNAAGVTSTTQVAWALMAT